MARSGQRSSARNWAHVSLYTVPARMVADLWPAIEPFALKACRYNPYVDADDLLTIFLAGRAQLFLATQGYSVLGFAAVEVVEYPRRKVANVFAAGGARGFLGVLAGPLLDLMQEWAAEQGADTFAATGRPGWMRFARRMGATELHYCVAWMRLDHGEGRRRTENSSGALEAGAAVPQGHHEPGPEFGRAGASLLP